MKVHKGYKFLQLTNPVVTLGIFDGVHLGHTALIKRLILRASEIKGESVVITFDPHPRIVLESKSENLSFLSTMDEKIELLDKAGADHLIIIEFNEDFSKMCASDFVENILVREIGTKRLVIGHDHHFGYHGGGNFDTLKECAGRMGFIVEQVEGLTNNGFAISSSRIREALLNGRLDEANRLLGYNYSLKGYVVEGRKIGRKIGFPTANLEPSDKYKLVPANGVYAVEVQDGYKKMQGMLSIGTNPTVNRIPGARSIEVHIFNFEKEIYGREIKIIFRHRLRDEERFDNTDELARQMKIDMDNALKALQ